MPKREELHVWIQRFKGRPNLMFQWIDPETGRRKSKSSETDDPEEAEKRRVLFEHDLREGRYLTVSKMTWERFREIYEEEKLDGDGTHNQLKAQTTFNRFEKEMNPRYLAKITERTISQFAVKLREAKYRATTVRGYLTYMKAALRWAKSQGMIAEVPRFVMPKADKGTNRKRIQAAASISATDFEQLLAFCPNDGWRLLILLCWHTGMRRVEARSIRGEDIDLDHHTIAVPLNKARDVAATVFITPELDEAIRRLYPTGIPKGKLIAFPDVQNTPGWISRDFGKIAEQAQVKGSGKTGWATLHDLRRAFGTRWAAKVPAQVLQRMMRHANLATTMTFYADVDNAAIAAMWQNVNSDVNTSSSSGENHQDKKVVNRKDSRGSGRVDRAGIEPATPGFSVVKGCEITSKRPKN